MFIVIVVVRWCGLCGGVGVLGLFKLCFRVIDLCAVCFMFRVGLLILWCSIVFGGCLGRLGLGLVLL